MITWLSSLDRMRALRIITHTIIGLGFSSVISQSMASDANPEKTPKPAISSPAANKKEVSGAKVLATVNGRAITQEEFDAVSVFPLANIKDDRLRIQAKNQILRDLIDEYLIEQTIAESKLDQDSIFKPLMEREKRRATLNTYQIYNAARSPVNLTNADIDAFIRSNKEYFGDRRTYRYIQFLLPPQSKAGTAYSVELVRNFTSKFSSAEFMNWLIAQEIDFQRVNLWQGSEQMPPAQLSAISKMKAGSVLVEAIAAPSTGAASSPNNNTDGIRVIYLIDSYPDPINADEARNSVARNLIARANKIKIDEAMQGLRARAKIEISDEILKEEITKLNQADSLRVAERTSARRLEYVRSAWFFCFLLLVPLALWTFFKSVPAISPQQGALRRLQKLEQTAYVRSIETLLAGFLLCFPLLRFVSDRLLSYDAKVITIAAVVGFSIALVVMLLVKKIPLLQEFNKVRLAAPIALFVIQYVAMVI